MISTLKELFRTLWISTSDYVWKKHIVIHLDFSLIASRSPEDFKVNFALELDDTCNFRLGYPNEETKASFLLNFMETVIEIDTEVAKNKIQGLTQTLNNGKLEEFFDILKTFFASVPYDIHIKKEQYYQSIFM